MHEDLAKLLLSAALGVLIGLERELKRKPLGLKTCLVICVTSCLLTIVSVDIAAKSNAIGGIIRADPMRLAAQIVSGIGFLGAGVIMRKSNEVISGLTTAAIVWASSGLGIAVGAGFYLDAIMGLILIVISVEFVPFVMRKFGPSTLREKEVEVTLVLRNAANVTDILHRASILDGRFERVRSRENAEGLKEIKVLCIVDMSLTVVDIFKRFEQIPEIERVSVERL